MEVQKFDKWWAEHRARIASTIINGDDPIIIIVDGSYSGGAYKFTVDGNVDSDVRTSILNNVVSAELM